MFWIILGYSSIAVALLWVMTCLWVYGSIEGEISPDTWHWKLYAWFYSDPPRSDCRYTRRLMLLPVLFALAATFAFVFYGIGAICCLVKDWIVIPFFLGERVAPISLRHYGEGLIGKQMKKCGDWRDVPERKSFIPFSPAIIVFIGVCLVYAYFASVYVYEHPTLIKETVDTATVGTLAIIAMIFIFQKSIRLGLKSGWAKWKEKTCHPIKAPRMD